MKPDDSSIETAFHSSWRIADAVGPLMHLVMRSSIPDAPWYGGPVTSSTYFFLQDAPPARTFVVDINALQDSLFAERMRLEPHSRFIVPDVAFVEMCKHHDCRLTLKLALKVFEKDSSQVFIAIGVPEALRMEMTTRIAIDSEKLLSSEFTHTVRNLIADLQQNEEEIASRIQADFEGERERLLSQDLNAEDARQRSIKLMQLVQKAVPPEVISAIRKSTLDWNNVIALAQWMSENLLVMHLQKSGMSKASAKQMVRTRPIHLRYYFLLARHTLQALKNGGSIPARADKELNNHLDMDYVMLASYFDGIISSDKKVVEAHSDLLSMLATNSSEAESTVAVWYAELGLTG